MQEGEDGDHVAVILSGFTATPRTLGCCCFDLVLRGVLEMGRTPGRRLGVESSAYHRSPLCVLICLPSQLQAGWRSSRLPGLRRGRSWSGLLACGFMAGR